MSDRVAMLEATLDLMDEGVAILDEQSEVLFWNEAAAAITGLAPRKSWREPAPKTCSASTKSTKPG